MMNAKNEGLVGIGRFRFHRAWLILIGCCFLQSGALGTILVSQGVFYVPVCEELGFARSQLSLWVTAYFVCSALCLPLAGKILSRFNIRIVLSVAAVAVATAAALMGTYTQLWQFIFSGVVYGTFGACLFMIPYSTMIGNWFAKKAGLAMGIASCVAALAAAGFAPMFQFFIDSIGWRSTYFIQGAIVLILVLPWSLFVFRIKPQDVGLHPYGYVEDEDVVDESAPRGELVTGVPFKKAIATLPFWLVFLYAGASALLGSGYDPHLPGLGISVGLTAVQAALLVTSLQLGSFAMKLLVGILNDKIGVKRTIYLEFIIIFSALIAMITLHGQWALYIAVFFFGVQDALVAISMPLVVRQLFGAKDFVRIYPCAQAGVSTFGAFASVLVGLSYDLSGSFTPALILGAVLCVVGFLFITLAYATRKRLIWEQ